jgi:hypothetical protein
MCTKFGEKRKIYLIIDDYSRFTWVLFLCHKSENFKIFVNFFNRVKNEKGSKIMKIRSDHGGEFEKYSI